MKVLKLLSFCLLILTMPIAYAMDINDIYPPKKKVGLWTRVVENVTDPVYVGFAFCISAIFVVRAFADEPSNVNIAAVQEVCNNTVSALFETYSQSTQV